MSRKFVLRIASLVLSLLVILSTLMACGQASDNSQKPEGENEAANTQKTAVEPVKKDVKLTAIAITDWVQDVDKKIAENFKNETGIEIDFQQVVADQYANILKTKMSAGEAPDVFFMWAGIAASQFIPEKNFADLSAMSWVSKVKEDSKKACYYDGKILAMPFEGGYPGWGLMYNKELFTKLNLSVPKTYNDFINVCETIKASGITPIYEPLKDSWHPGLWLATLGPIADKNNPGLYDGLNDNSRKFAGTKEFDTFLTQFKELYSKGYFGENALSNTWDKAISELKTGNYAMFYTYATFNGTVMVTDPTADFSKWEMFPVPLVDNTLTGDNIGGITRVINKNSKNMDECMQYFEYLGKTENMTLWATERKLTPAYTDIPYDEPLMSKTLRENSSSGSRESMEFGLNYWDNTTEGKYIIELLLDGKTPQNVLEAVDADREKLFTALSK